jgi:hypothetical protein
VPLARGARVATGASFACDRVAADTYCAILHGLFRGKEHMLTPVSPVEAGRV